MTLQNEAFVLYGINQAKIEPYPAPSELGSEEILCKTLKVGICGSDIHYLKEGRLGTFVVNEPLILGHETVAEVVEVGSNVKNLKSGDRVAIEPAIPCDKCEWCNNNLYNLCQNIKCHATPPYHGSLQRYFKHPAKWSFKVPDDMSTEAAALAEPTAVAVHACSRVDITPGCRMLITGAGPIGLLVLQTAKAMGAGQVVITDIKEDRLALAKEVGADQTILVKKENTEEELVKMIQEAFGGDLPHISMECSGYGGNFRLVMLATRPNGNIMMVGMGPNELNLPIATTAFREGRILGCFRYRYSFPKAIELLSTKKIKADKMVSHRFEFKDSMDAFEMAASGNGMKVIISFV